MHLNEVTFGVRNEIAQGTLGRQKEDQVTPIANVSSEHGKRREQFVTEQRKISQHQEINYENTAQQLQRLTVKQGNSNYPRLSGGKLLGTIRAGPFKLVARYVAFSTSDHLLS